jgi:hypothetical protein
MDFAVEIPLSVVLPARFPQRAVGYLKVYVQDLLTRTCNQTSDGCEVEVLPCHANQGPTAVFQLFIKSAHSAAAGKYVVEKYLALQKDWVCETLELAPHHGNLVKRMRLGPTINELRREVITSERLRPLYP